ncbi:hypothetical protein G9F72_011090 [Clostridium estertheticum]|nr:hypothetical protein [Clostridium estertheticum]MBZ9686870.1 hypothetical protein [Clostridium estertheticum]
MTNSIVLGELINTDIPPIVIQPTNQEAAKADLLAMGLDENGNPIVVE